jgi:phage terminase large subunit-like protein
VKVQDLKSYKYAQSVLNGEQIASNFIKLAAERFMNDLERDDLVFRTDVLEVIYSLIENDIYVPETRQKNVVFPPHAFWLDQLYGFRYKETDKRKYTTMYLQFARKNFKTFYAALVSIIETILWRDRYPEILVGANSRDQALICTTKIGEIIKVSPFLKELWNNNNGYIKMYAHKDHINTILFENEERKSVIKAIPRDLGDGGNPSIGIIDEFHEAKSTALIETIQSGQGQRADPLTMIITSPGNDRASVCYDERETSRKILTGDLKDDRHLAILFELDNEEEWDQIDLLEKSNPMMPYVDTLKPYLERRITEAKKYGGGKAANVKIKNCGIWIDAPEVWIEKSVLQENNHGIRRDDLKDYPVYVGFDLAKSKDLNALCIMADVDGVMVFDLHYWISEEKLKDDSDKVDYLKWHEKGYMHVMDGDTIDFYDLGLEICDILKEYSNIQVIAFDVRYSYMGVVPVLKAQGYEDLCIPVGQGATLAPATIQLEKWLEQRKCDLMSNEVLFWNFANVILKYNRNGDPYPTKEDRFKKIDGVVAILTAMEEYLRINAEFESDIYIGGL